MSCNKLVKALQSLVNLDELADKIEEVYGENDDDSMSCREIAELVKAGQVSISISFTCYDKAGDYVGDDSYDCEQSGDGDYE